MKASRLQALLVLTFPVGLFFLAKSLGRIVYSGDNITYILLAKSIFTASPFTQSFIGYFYFDHPVHYHHYVFQPLFPLALSFGSFLTQTASVETQYFTAVFSNALITLFCVWAFYKLLCTLGVIDKRLRLAGVALLVVLPAFVISSITVFSEIFYLGLLFLQLHFFMEGMLEDKPLWKAGFFLGLLYLARPNAVFVAFAEIIFILIVNKNVVSRFKQLFILFVLVSAFWWMRNYFIFGDPFFSVYKFQMWIGSNDFAVWKSTPSLDLYLAGHTLANTLHLWGGRMLLMLMDMASPKWISLLLIPILGIPFSNRKNRQVILFLFLIFSANLAGLGLHFFAQERHLLTFNWVLAALAVLSVQTLSSKRKFSFLISILLLFYSFCLHLDDCKDRYIFLKNDAAYDKELQNVGLWLRENLPPGARILATPADAFHFYSGAPTVGIPSNITSADLAELARKYNLSYYVKRKEDPPPPPDFKPIAMQNPSSFDLFSK